MTWLFVLVAWTLCGAVAAPLVGRVLVHGERVGHSARRAAQLRSLPTPRSPLVLL